MTPVRVFSMTVAVVGVVLVLFTALPTCMGGDARVFRDWMPLQRHSETFPGNVLPAFLFMQGAEEGGSTVVPLGGGRGTPHPFVPDDSCGADIWDNAMEDLRSPQLPYLSQDQWGCERQPRKIPVADVESDGLLARVTPQWGGKVWSLFSKVHQRDLVYANPAHQPANIGALKAWTSGGIEFNYSPGIIGHAAFTESPVYVARHHTDKGDGLRVYEMDRYNNSVWQTDIWAEDDVLWTHVKLTNPTPDDLRAYWWTCVAHHVTPRSRIITPADSVAETSAGTRCTTWPTFTLDALNASFHGLEGSWGTDNSYLGNFNTPCDSFVRIPAPKRPYIAHVDETGFTVLHGHPLNGTKFFTWGQNGPGRFMQDFLAGGNIRAGHRVGDYAELQIGLAPTQLQAVPFPHQSVIEWTEWWTAFQGNTTRLHSPHYPDAVHEVDDKMTTIVPKERFDAMDEFLRHHADDPIDSADILYHGSSWGALNEELRGKVMAPGCRFEILANDDEVRPWLELVRNGTFSETTLRQLPTSYMIGEDWIALLEQSVKKYGETWLHHLHIGVANAERGDVAGPRDHFTASMSLRPSATAARCLAVLSRTPEEAWPWYQKAWELALAIQHDDTQKAIRTRLLRNLCSEMCFFLQNLGWYDELSDLLKHLPHEADHVDAILTSHIKVALHRGDWESAIKLLGKECFPTYASDRRDLMNMWNQANVLREAARLGRPLTPLEERNVRLAHPVPPNIGCPYGADYCANYWN
eukprot:TRINITY_DN939_c2_g3_i1.p1 TRINITY_DN939_c2_g3~~TRINITY_DN939_c2_g3_i1.p1  ORF type:complete len:750 (-),score=131.17 TRINITY_DN939_c2_g3_i1:61-2310(-)